jgi:WD40 repeat protein
MTPPPAPASSSPKDDIHGLTEQIENYAEIPWPRPLTPILTPPGGPLLRTLTGDSGYVMAVAVTPDGRRAVSASDDRTLKVWDLESGEELGTLTGHSRSVEAVAVTLDGRRAVSASDDQTLKVWDLESGKLIATFSADGAFYACAVVPDVGAPWDSVIVAGGASGRVHFLRLEGDESLKR